MLGVPPLPLCPFLPCPNIDISCVKSHFSLALLKQEVFPKPTVNQSLGWCHLEGELHIRVPDANREG